MNIANIFGMHMGCNVKTGGSIGKLVSVSGDYDLVGVKENKSYHDDYVEYQIIDCKLILTPLSAITEEDKREFEKVFRVRNNQKVAGVKKNGVYVEISIESDRPNDFYNAFATPDEIDFLRSKGYDINVPDEYKIVEG